jgi:Ca-activated chloride channel family protein
MTNVRTGWTALLVCAGLQTAAAADLFLRGKVTLEDGSPPGKPLTIERVCIDSPDPIRASTTNAKGEYYFRMPNDGFSAMSWARTCALRASVKTYYSTSVDISEWNWFSDPNLPNIVLINRSEQPSFDLFTHTKVPREAANAWLKAAKAIQSRNWEQADFQLRVAVKTYPRFSEAWHALGIVSEQLGDVVRAREAEHRAIELNPKLLPAQMMLARLDVMAQDWPGALKTTDALIAADAKKRYPEAHIQRAIAQYYLRNLNEAEASAKECIRSDKNRDLPRAEYILGLILEAQHNLDAAREHLQRYLTQAPRAADAGDVRNRLEHIGTPQAADLATAMKQVVARIQPSAMGEAWVPGGMKALGAMANSGVTSSSADFFGSYCSALVRESSPGLSSGIPGYHSRLSAYMATMVELGHSGERRGAATEITLSLDDAHRKNTERVLGLLGWRIAKDTLELSDAPGDLRRQQFAAALGIDPVALQEALEAGRSFPIQIPSENARLAGGDAWVSLIKDLSAYPGGMAEAFARDFRLGKTCAGLHAMSPEAAAAVLSGIGLQVLAEKLADPLARYAEAFAMSADGVATPGAEDAWQKLTGVSPRKPGAFFRALLERDEGALAAFYYTLSQADSAHQRYFTATPQRAERVYAWYRDSGEPRWSRIVPEERWRTRLLQDLPLDSGGNVRFPGGRGVWTNASNVDDETLLKLPALKALLHAAGLEQRRGSPLDQKSAALLAQFDAQWQPLFFYFEQWKWIGSAELEALAVFTQAAAKLPRETQNTVLAEWYSLVELISRGANTGALDAVESAKAFRRVCEELASSGHNAKAIELSRALGGQEILRLTPARRATFDRIMAMQNVPRLDDPAKAAAALSGMVYAATLNPDGLLVGSDPLLLSKHRFAGGETLFAPSRLDRSNQVPGSHFSGGFAGFAEIAAKLAKASPVIEDAGPIVVGDAVPVVPTQTESEPSVAEAVFRSQGRLVEVYATVTDSRGRYVDDLTQDQFTIFEQGKAQPMVGFESRSAEVSVALLLDTTVSMEAALPAVKNAAVKLIADLRPADSVAVYSFNDRVTALQAFTTDKVAAKRAILRTEPMGETALYDALVRVNRDLSGRTGKKVIIVFTDGDDNSSTLTAQAAIQRAKGAGIPVYTIAQGEALSHPDLLKQLADVSRATGGSAFVIHNAAEVRGVFEKISQDLQHGYFFLFQPAPAEGQEWRSIDVRVRASGAFKIRAREGYYPE